MRSRKTRQLIVRIVPRLHADEDAERGIFDVSFTGSRVELAGSEKRFRIVGVILQDGRAQLHLSSAFFDPLSHLKRR
jgi:hypothetical protein